MNRQKIQKRTWCKLRPSLNGSYDYSNNWKKVIDSFQLRIFDYYLNPIDKILQLNICKGEGFSILTLQCALIEMFAAFLYGKVYNRKKPKKGGLKYEYGNSNSCFIEFLQTEYIFENHFFIIDANGDRIINQPFNANQFYDRVRCGLMHEARTKKEWLINVKSKDIFHSNTFITEDNINKTKSINRTILQAKLKDYFESKYLKELRQDNPNGIKLRRFLARKLDHLYDIPKEKSFEWWLDK